MTFSSVPEPGPASNESGRQARPLSAQLSQRWGITPYHQKNMKKAKAAARYACPQVNGSPGARRLVPYQITPPSPASPMMRAVLKATTARIRTS